MMNISLIINIFIVMIINVKCEIDLSTATFSASSSWQACDCVPKNPFFGKEWNSG